MSQIVFHGNSIDYLELDGQVLIDQRPAPDPLGRHLDLVTGLAAALRKVIGR